MIFSIGTPLNKSIKANKQTNGRIFLLTVACYPIYNIYSIIIPLIIPCLFFSKSNATRVVRLVIKKDRLLKKNSLPWSFSFFTPNPAVSLQRPFIAQRYAYSYLCYTSSLKSHYYFTTKPPACQYLFEKNFFLFFFRSCSWLIYSVNIKTILSTSRIMRQKNCRFLQFI